MSTTREQLKPTGHPCLYRHEGNKNYYGKKKHKGKTVTKALRMDHGDKITDRKLAEAALRKWSDELDAPAKTAVPTFRQIYERFLEAKSGKADNTKKNYAFYFKAIENLAPAIPGKAIDAIRRGPTTGLPFLLSRFSTSRLTTN
jgi:hypothetical protein